MRWSTQNHLKAPNSAEKSGAQGNVRVNLVSKWPNFGGNWAGAFTFYKDTFGGEFADFCRFKDAPSESQTAAEESEWIVHVSLPIGQGTALMGRDRPSAMGEATIGNNFNISIRTDSEDRFGVPWMVSQESG